MATWSPLDQSKWINCPWCLTLLDVTLICLLCVHFISPVHESLKIIELGIKSGTEIIIERGEPPRSNQVYFPSLNVCFRSALLVCRSVFPYTYQLTGYFTLCALTQVNLWGILHNGTMLPQGFCSSSAPQDFFSKENNRTTIEVTHNCHV